MKAAQYVEGESVEIVEVPEPDCPSGGLVIRTEACGLSSLEVTKWYMDARVSRVMGHENSGIVHWSGDPRFPVGYRVFVHQHAPCMLCGHCERKRFVHCAQWKRTKLTPGGMAEYFSVTEGNLRDAFIVDDLSPESAALIEPLACVAKSLKRAGIERADDVAVVGLGSMGLLHALMLGPSTIAYEIRPARLAWAKKQFVKARTPDAPSPADVVFVCTGNQSALDFAVQIVRPGGKIVLFSPFPPDEPPQVPANKLFFNDVALVPAYSCGPEDTRQAAEWLRAGKIRANQVVNRFFGIDELPEAYQAMKAGEILKAMVVFP